MTAALQSGFSFGSLACRFGWYQQCWQLWLADQLCAAAARVAAVVQLKILRRTVCLEVPYRRGVSQGLGRERAAEGFNRPEQRLFGPPLPKMGLGFCDRFSMNDCGF